MEQQKRKDLMSSAMSDFWASDYKIGQPKINAPRVKNIEDNAFDSLWGRGEYASTKKLSFNTSPRPSPVKYQLKVVMARSRVAELQAELQKKQIEDKIAEINARRFKQNMEIAKRVARSSTKLTVEGTKSAIAGAKQARNAAADFYNKYIKKKEQDMTKVPVGTAGAIYTANKAAGKKSLYD